MKVCEIMLVQEIPNSVFVDNDQLNTLKKLNKVSVFVAFYRGNNFEKGSRLLKLYSSGQFRDKKSKIEYLIQEF